MQWFRVVQGLLFGSAFVALTACPTVVDDGPPGRESGESLPDAAVATHDTASTLAGGAGGMASVTPTGGAAGESNTNTKRSSSGGAENGREAAGDPRGGASGTTRASNSTTGGSAKGGASNATAGRGGNVASVGGTTNASATDFASILGNLLGGGGFSFGSGLSPFGSGTSTTGTGLSPFGSGTSFGSGNTTSGSGVSSGDTGSTPASSGGTTPVTTGSEEPVIPGVTGTCPNFATGTVSVAGLGGISLQVGAKQSGTGSLLFYWHGTGSSASEVNMMVPAAVRNEILNQGGIIVSFGSSLRTGGDCSGTATFSKDDFKVADTIAACAVRDHNIDPRRIYTTGCSAGGLQAGCMAALRSSYIAATVPNSGGTVMQQALQDASHVPAVMTMHGGASDQVVVAFSQTSATLDSQMKKSGGFVVNCDHGGGHCGAPAALYTAGWEFMKAHPFGVEPEPYGSGLPASFPSYCSIYQ